MADGWAIWITGLPGSGKSVVARALQQTLLKEGIQSQIVSSDQLRTILTPEPVYSQKERDMIYRAISYIVEILVHNGVNVIVDATGNKRKYREDCRSKIKFFFEVYLRCPLETCIERESSRKERYMAPKDIYLKAQTSSHNTVPGMGEPYEAPKKPEVLVDSDILLPYDISTIIKKYLEKNLF